MVHYNLARKNVSHRLFSSFNAKLIELHVPLLVDGRPVDNIKTMYADVLRPSVQRTYVIGIGTWYKTLQVVRRV